MKDKLAKLSKTSSGSILLLLLAVVYTISPIDLIPDVIPVIGWLDDIGLDGTAIFLVVKGFLDRKASSYIKEEGNKSTVKKVLVNSGNTIKESKNTSSNNRSKNTSTENSKSNSSKNKDNTMNYF